MLIRLFKIFCSTGLVTIILSLTKVDTFVINPTNSFVKNFLKPRRTVFKDDDLQYSVPSFLDLVNKHKNYCADEYLVKTEDGYVLKIHRMQHLSKSKLKRNNSTEKPVMFLQHGFLQTSEAFVFRGPGEDLAFLLAESGYDIWLGNLRGNTYSNPHKIRPSIPRSSFFDFSFHEHGVYDLKAMIDFVLNVTGQQQAGYVGFSMGTTIGYVLLSQHPSYNQKIRAVYNLAPITSVGKDLKPLVSLFLKDFSKPAQIFFNFFGPQEFLPRSPVFNLLGNIFCSERAPLREVCVTISMKIFTMNRKTAESMLPRLFTYYPAGSSTKILQQYAENYRTGKFGAIDYGYQNFMKYGHLKAPVYDLSKVTTRVNLWYSIEDQLINYKDVEKLIRNLPNITSARRIEAEDFNHNDFLFSMKAKRLIYNQLLQIDESFLRH